MEIHFNAGDHKLRFRRNWFTGKAFIDTPAGRANLDNPLNPGTHFSLSLVRIWRITYAGHDIVIEKVRPQLVAGFRPHGYRISVDGAPVASAKGY